MMSTDVVLTVAFFGASAFGLAGIALAAYLVRHGWTLGARAGKLSLRH